jgi:hypothetical protein
MTRRADFNAEEWSTVVNGPLCILVIVLMGIVLTSLSLRTIATYDR